MESYTAVLPVDSLKQEDLLFCLTCLSKGREMRPLGANKQLFQKLCENNESMSLDDVLLCWECHAVLNKVTKFVHKANQVEIILSNCERHVNSLSSLKSVQGGECIELEYVGEDEILKAIKREAAIEIERDNDKSDFAKDFDYYVHVEEEKSVGDTAKLEYNVHLDDSELRNDKGLKNLKSDDVSGVTCKVETRDDNRSLELISRARCSRNRRQKYKDCVLDVSNQKDNERTYRLIYLTRDQVDDWNEKARRDDSYIRNEYKCNECVLSWKRAKQLNDHRHRYHNNKFRYICDVCTCSYQNKRSLIMHMRIHFCDFVCQVCNEQFHKRKQMHIHFRTVHKDLYSKWRPSSFRMDRGMQCDLCHLKVNGKCQLRAHKRSMHDAGMQSTQTPICQDCNIHFKNMRGLKSHLKTSASHCATNGKRYKQTYIAPFGTEIKTDREFLFEQNATDSLETKEIKYKLSKHNENSSSEDENDTESGANTRLAYESKYTVIQMSEDEMCKVRKQMRESPEYVKSDYKCEMCIIGFRRKYLYDLHLTEKHFEKLGEPCPICQVRYLSEELGPHQRGHYTLYQCDMCQYRNPDLGAMQQHHSLRHATRVGDKLQTQYKCKHCPHLPVFKSRSTHKYHMRTQHSLPRLLVGVRGRKPNQSNVPKVPKVECDLCHKMLAITGLANHKRLVHVAAKDESAFCIECNKQFKHMASYNAHMMFHSNHLTSTAKKYECDICGKKFAHSLLVRAHRNKVHLRLSEKICHICHKTFITGTGLSRHVKLVHEGVKDAKDHECMVCGRMFTKQLLKQHMNTHTGDRPYHCQLCADTFAQKSSLYMHNRLVHLKLKKNRKPAKSKEGL